MSSAIVISSMNESRLEGLYIIAPRGDAVYIGQATPGMYCTVPMLHRLVIRGDAVYSQGAGINLNAGSSDAQVIGCDIGFFTNGPGIFVSGHNGFEIIGCQNWQCLHGYQLFAASRGRLVGCLSDYAQQYGFAVQNATDIQFIGCQARESSLAAANTYDGFFVQGTDLGNTCFDIVFTGCPSHGFAATIRRKSLRICQPNTSCSLRLARQCERWIRNRHGSRRLGALGQYAADNRRFRQSGFRRKTVRAGRYFLNLARLQRPVQNGVLPASVQGYLDITIAGLTYKVPYYNN